MSKVRKLNMISDPGHGWLSVNVKDLIALGIEDKISSYSYLNKTCAYLEEDCDAGIYLKAARDAGWNVSIKEKYQEKTAIRSFPHFSQENMNKFMNMNVGGIFYLFNSSKKNYSVQAKITEIVGSKLYLLDEYGNRYKSGFARLVKCSALNLEQG